ncbi:MAG: GGDEF domain-containing protein [Clostridia bacterium]|nr:GGDEF domain-containing protein [Clostridia bacterium]
MKYYTPLIVLVWLTLIILAVLVKENDRFSKDKKRTLYLSYLIVALAAFFEWLGVCFSGNAAVPHWLVRAVKLFDYILTPVSGGMIVLQIKSKSIWKKILFSLIAVNTLYQIVSLFTGWMITIDADNQYSHGPGYLVYVIFYLIALLLVLFDFTVYGKKFRNRNSLSLYATLGFVITGIAMQEVLGGEVRTAYISLTICLALLFIHNSEFAQLASDDLINEQMIRISEDPLTGLFSRYAYNEKIRALSDAKKLPQDLIVFSIDINGLKTINDTLGHNAGDELICGAAECIVSAFKPIGDCYRTGGDEFIVIANTKKAVALDAVTQLKMAVDSWRGKEVRSLSLSVGFAEAALHPGMDIENLIASADLEMYKEKTAYYEKNGIERRKK